MQCLGTVNFCSSKHKRVVIVDRSCQKHHRNLYLSERRGRGVRRIWCSNEKYNLSSLDSNQLQTQLNLAIQTQDFSKAAQIRNRLKEVFGENGQLDWRSNGALDWLAHRLEQLGYRYPLEIQRKSWEAICSGSNVYIRGLTGSGKTLAYLIPLLSKLKYDKHVNYPQLLVVVPTFELGVQLALLTYQLFGGSIHVGIPDNPDNMFRFIGPRGLKVRGLLSKEEVIRAKNVDNFLNVAQVVIATPDCILETCSEPQPIDVFSNLDYVVMDEVDACCRNTPNSITHLFQHFIHKYDRCQVVCVGASPSLEVDELLSTWLKNPIQTIFTADHSLLPASMQHKYHICNPTSKLLLLSKLIKADLMERDSDKGPCRVMVFASSEEEALRIGSPLRKALWGLHKVVVLIPSGENPVLAIQSFRDNEATLLVACSASARGLDLPNITHIYNFDVPEDEIVYLHQAGRGGRIGSVEKEVNVLTLLQSQQELQQLKEIAKKLQIPLSEKLEPVGATAEDQEVERQSLEDLYNLIDIDEQT